MSPVTTPGQLVRLFAAHPAVAAVAAAVTGERRIVVAGVANSARALLAAELARRTRRPVCLAVSREDEAALLRRDATLLSPDVPSRQFTPLVPGRAGADSGAEVVFAGRRSLESPALDPARRDEFTRELSDGTVLSIDDLVGWLDEAGYERVDLATEPGEFAARGGIVDVFAEGEARPVRIEFTGDAIASLRLFDPLSQRSAGRTGSLTVYARRRPAESERLAWQTLPDRTVFVADSPVAGLEPLVTLTDRPEADFDLGCRPAPRYLGNFRLLADELGEPGHRHFIACSTEERCARVERLLGDGPDYLSAPLGGGFTDAATGYTLLTELELYGAPARRVARPRFKGLPVDNLVTLRPGDNVVHVDYGIGLFEGTRRMHHGGTEKDYLVVRYAGKDRVYVPVENLGLIDRYVGTGDAPARLDRLGGRTWLVAKAKAARSSAEYAEELLDIQARRSAAPGFAFPPDADWHARLADSFPFEETADQLRALDAVRQDMEQGRPMDRLVCGDVGYGKTEVALRAALKAVAGTRQVAVLVPTTILCYQHFATFRRRLAPFPVRVEMLSRLVSPTKQQRIRADLASGKVDIVIGTHGLLSPRTRFRDLGLLVLDEEQKFGVRQKEKIKQLRASVDVLTLTATPVPRTLYMAVAGLRDISTIHTPPPGRREVQTEVSPWNDALVAEYVGREVERDGQVFFVHNRIQTLTSVARRLDRMFPGIDIAVAHGQMASRRLEEIYLGFAAGEHRILLSTAIIESGLDLPNVNTIIVDRADLFGLADLHQLRGRVGRSGRQAYALFLVSARREVTPEARKRLSALLAYSRLGSGFRLALRDLEIRGAGDLLGTRQHGHIARIGLNLYAKMLRDAAARIRGEEVAPEPELKLDVTAYLPNAYVTDSFERVALYRRLLGLDSEKELEEFQEELIDRFGDYPPVVENLFRIALVRIRARRHGLLRVTLKDGTATLATPETTLSDELDLAGLVARLGQDTL